VSLLVARPCLEEWGIVVDYRNKKAMYLDEDPQTWSDIETNEKGHMIIDLLSCPDDALEVKEEPSTTDADADGDHEAKSDNEVAYCVTSTHGEEKENAETTDLDAEQLNNWFAKANRMLDEKPKVKRKFWDIFVNEGRISQCVEQRGDFKASEFTLDTGWYFTKKSHSEAFFEKLRRDRPEGVWISPPCTLWSTINTLNDASEDDRYRRQRRREREKQKKDFLKFSREIYDEQLRNERDAHLGHLRYAASWKEDVWQNMVGYDTFVDQCAYGLKALDRDGHKLGPIKKPTNARTTKYNMHEGLWRRCSCKEKHVMLEGARNVRGVENYPRSMAFQAAICIVDDPQSESSYVVEEMTQEEFDKIECKEVWKTLLAKFTIDEVKWVEKVHVQMGHPSSEALAAALKEMNADDRLVSCARIYRCEVCLKRQRYEVDAVVKDEKAKTEIKAIEKNWINWAGVQARTRADQSGARVSEDFSEWCDARQIKLQFMPRDAHHRLGILERNHQGRREQIAKYHEDRPDDSLKVTVRVTCDMRNRLRDVGGFTPAQRALRRQPRDLGNVADEPATLGDLGEHDEEFYQNMARRSFRSASMCISGGRDKGESDLIKSYWKGPAMVAQVECTGDPDKSRQSVVWCVHNNALLRLLEKLKDATGSIKYKDCVGEAPGDPGDYVDDGRPEGMDVDAEGVDTDGQVAGPGDGQARPDEDQRSGDEAEPFAQAPSEAQPQDAAGETRPEAAVQTNEGEREPDLEAASRETAEDVEPEAKVEKRKADDRDELLDSINAARRLDGLRSLMKRPKITPMETQTKTARLTMDERKQFDEAKTKTLMPWIENQAWQAVNESTADAGEICPRRFLLKWGMKDGVREANARVILQEFHLEEVTSTNMEKASPTLTRLARYSILLILCQQSWKMIAADVKSAFLQANDTREQGVRIFCRPTKDIQRRLAKLMNLKGDEILQMLKPAFGDVRAPRQWNQTITEAMIDIGFLQRQLDRCCFLSYRVATEGDGPFLVWGAGDGQNYVLDGVLGLHVDDFIGGGENLECEADLTDKQAYEGTFLDRVQNLSMRNEIEVKTEAYIHKVKPISIEKVRRQHPDDLCRPKEISQLRGLNGAMQWPASQCMVQAAATVSFAQGDVSKATVGSLLEANKSLRFLNTSGDVGIRIRYVSKWEVLRLGVYWDASWATRPNGESQGGYMIFAIEDERTDDGQPTFLVILEWASRKLVRICRSSLAGEVQAAANAVGALEFAKTMLTTMLYPNQQLAGKGMLQVLGRSPCIADCKALYDAANSQAPAGGLTERRTGIEIMQVSEKMRDCISNL
ncbi:unnamed protein product, partial [Prorocentrum cordatum]